MQDTFREKPQATSNQLAGQIWPTGWSLDMPELQSTTCPHSFFFFFFTEKIVHHVVVFTEDSLECEAALRTGAEVLSMVETNHLARAADTRDAREEAGGSTFAALLLLVGENLVIHLLGVHNTLGEAIITPI